MTDGFSFDSFDSLCIFINRTEHTRELTSTQLLYTICVCMYVHCHKALYQSMVVYVSNFVSKIMCSVHWRLISLLICMLSPTEPIYDQLIPWIASLTWVTTVIPLAIVLAVTALKDLIDDVVSYLVAMSTSHTTIDCSVLSAAPAKLYARLSAF
jgi:hypothetical protein